MAHSITSAPLNWTAVPEAAGAKFCDTLDIDHDENLLYAGDNWSGGVDVFDIATPEPRYIKTISIRGRIFGIAVARNVDKLFVGVSGSVVAVVDIGRGSDNSGGLVAQLDTGGSGHTDLLDYDPIHKRLYAANRIDGFMTCIDAATNRVVGRVEGLGKGLEQPRFNSADGMVYLTDNRENVLYQIDPVACKLVATFEIADACYPNGMAINPETNQALLACSNRDRPHTVIWDLNAQAIVSIIEDSGCGDGAIYDATIDRFFFAAAGFGAGPVMGIFGGNPVRLLSNVSTARGASWVAYDRKNRLVYAPAIQNGKPALLSFPLPPIKSGLT
jgi:DNA-binding beta-propeller fold protein YncE